ncbi:hypothetical protein ZWY2020_000565 [Hordeum vulgare]|nr:hypothetical protein ZWY2020_000565 [Hordeum vulgare]
MALEGRRAARPSPGLGRGGAQRAWRDRRKRTAAADGVGCLPRGEQGAMGAESLRAYVASVAVSVLCVRVAGIRRVEASAGTLLLLCCGGGGVALLAAGWDPA